MAISGFGAGIQSLAQCFKKDTDFVPTKDYVKTGVAQALAVTDALVGVTLLVLGVLALLNILQLPEGWGAAFAYGAMAAGAVNLLASALSACQASKIQYEKCSEPTISA